LTAHPSLRAHRHFAAKETSRPSAYVSGERPVTGHNSLLEHLKELGELPPVADVMFEIGNHAGGADRL
jgi:hypothetical protein